MKSKESMRGFPLISVLAVLAGIWLGSFLAACGSDDDPVVRVPVNNHLFNGVYHLYIMEHDESSDPPVKGGALTANGDGTITAPGLVNVGYAIYADRSFKLYATDGSFESAYGRISNNGDVLAFTDTVYDLGATSDVELMIAVRNSSGRTQADMEGDYVIYQAGVKNTGEFYTARVGVIVNALGIGNAVILSHSLGDTGNIPVTAILNGDGTFIGNNTSGDDYGILSPDGNFFVVADYSDTDGDNEMILSVGIRNSTTAPDVTGDFLINQVGLANGVAEEYTARVSLNMGASTYDYQILAHSLGDAGSMSGISYTVNSVGIINAGTPVDVQATQDGRVMAFSGTDNITDDELVFGIGIK